jgi:hypothetical protein
MRYILSKDLGYDNVKRMSMREFKENWEIGNLLNLCSTPDGKKELETRRGVKKAEHMEQQHIPAAPFDPSTASPEELDAWIRTYGGGNYA